MQSNFQQNGMNPSLKHMGSHTISNRTMWQRTDDILQRVCLSALSSCHRKSFISPITTQDHVTGHFSSYQESSPFTFFSPLSFQLCKSLCPLSTAESNSHHRNEQGCHLQVTETQAKVRRNRLLHTVSSSRTGRISNRAGARFPGDQDKTSLSRAWFCIPVLVPHLDSLRQAAGSVHVLFKYSGKERVPFLKDL